MTVEHRVMSDVPLPSVVRRGAVASIGVVFVAVLAGALLAACGAPPTSEGRIGAVTSAPRAAGAPDLPGAPVATNPDGTPVLGGASADAGGARRGGAGSSGSDGAGPGGAGTAGREE